ncbi:MAG: Ig-like domain-containing protein [Acidobacteria bacterium]|nr:Ig-like domain-containing protein [Acidobacteriota bacterium]
MNKKYFFILFLTLGFLLTTNDFYQEDIAIKANSRSFEIKQKSPVVNEGNQITLTAIDNSGNSLTNGVSWKSGSPDIAEIETTTGKVLGIKAGFATITAIRGSETFSVFLAVTRVKKGNGLIVPGDTKTDAKGAVYISNPLQNVIFKTDNALNSKLKIFAGKPKIAGNRNGLLAEALFAGPTAIGVDNRDKGGIYVTDTLNHSVRKIGFDKQVETIIGRGFPGVSRFNEGFTGFDQILLNSPRGIVTDNGGNLYIADTDNHAIYYVDSSLEQIFLVAGEPGESGKEDGMGREARFRRPSGMALSSDGRLLTVADEDNNRVRLIELLPTSKGAPIGRVSTLSKTEANQNIEISFSKPQSVGIDGLGTIYVVDGTGVQVVNRISDNVIEVSSLAQENTFNKAISLTVKGSEVFVLDNSTAKINTLDSKSVASGVGVTSFEEFIDLETSSEALKIVSVGAPIINSIEPDTITLENTKEVIVKGKNFAPKTQVVVGGELVSNVSVISAEELRFPLNAPKVPGKLTLSLLTRGGLAQSTLSAVAPAASSIGVGQITTVTGGSIFSGDGADAKQTGLAIPTKIIADSKNNLFISEFLRVRRVDANTGIITTVAGGGSSVFDRVLATTAKLSIISIALNGKGNLVIADTIGSNRIREVDSLTNTITTIAGGNGFISSGDGGPAIKAGFRDLRDITFDKDGNLLVLEATRLRRISARTGIINTIAGTGRERFDGDGGPATQASLGDAFSIALDKENNIFICENLSERIRKIDAKTGIITTVAGTGNRNDANNRNGKLATRAGLIIPEGIAISPDGDLFISDFGGDFQASNPFASNEILQVSSKTGILSTKSIKLDDSFLPPDFTVGKIAFDGLGNLFFTAFPSFVYRFNIATQEATLVAGNKNFNLFGDNILAEKASIGVVEDIAVDSSNNLYLADYRNGLVRKIDAVTREISTIVGKDTSNTTGNGDGGLGINAICFPYALAIDNQDNLLIADNRDNFLEGSRIRKLDLKTGIITSIAGNGIASDIGDGELATNAGFSFIFEIVVDNKNNAYVYTSSSGGKVRRIDSNTKIVTSLILGNTFSGFVIATDKLGNLIFEDSNILKQINPLTKQIVIIGGNGSTTVSGDGGLVNNAGLGSIISLSIDGDDNLFLLVFDFQSQTYKIRRIDAQTKIITTVADSKIRDYSGDGKPLSEAGLDFLSRLVINKDGNIFVLVNGRIDFNAVRFIKLR